jgi:hypothetical protein
VITLHLASLTKVRRTTAFWELAVLLRSVTDANRCSRHRKQLVVSSILRDFPRTLPAPEHRADITRAFRMPLIKTSPTTAPSSARTVPTYRLTASPTSSGEGTGTDGNSW